jgi:RimJ/RimL family protein N-acetyltransferase
MRIYSKPRTNWNYKLLGVKMIVGERVIIQPMEVDDLEFVKDLYNDEEISILEGRWEFPLSMLHQENWFKKHYDDDLNKSFVILDKSNNERVGYTSINCINWHSRRAHTAIKLHKNAGGKGFGYDSIMTLMSYAFNKMNLEKLYGEIIEYNKASYHAYVEKCGWKVEGIFRKHVLFHGKYYDMYPVSILKEEFDKIAKGTPYYMKDFNEVYGKIKVKEFEKGFDI